jgi:hypothetical protein
MLGLAKNLLSVAQITSTGNTIVTFTHDQCVIKTTSPTSHQTMLFRVPKDGNLFSLGIGIDLSAQNNVATSKSDLDTLKWHYRLGHLNLRYLGTM